MKTKRIQFDLVTALMLMIAVSILIGLNLEATIYKQVPIVRAYGWPFVCCEVIESERFWKVTGSTIDAVVAALILIGIQVGRDRLLRARAASEEPHSPG